MESLTPEFLALVLTWYVVLLFSLSVHESAHGWMAFRMGDPTAVSEGRVSLNPLVHIDPIGTVLMPFLQVAMGGFPFLAWAKPTPVGAHNFRKLARGHLLVAGAGPASNLILALLFSIALFVAYRVPLSPEMRNPVFSLIKIGVQLNVALALFNLIPIPPLDGSWIASWGLPRPMGERYDRVMEPMGGWLLLLLIYPIGFLLGPLVSFVTTLLYAVVS